MLASIFSAVVSLALGAHYTGYFTLPTLSSNVNDDLENERFLCRPFLPSLFPESPLQFDNPHIKGGSDALGRFISTRFSEGDIDSLSLAVVSSDGILFEGNYGFTRSNETGPSPVASSDSIYRVASVSKLFTVLEGHILAEKGIISW